MATRGTKGPIIDPGLCRCCGTSKKCRLLTVEYEWIGQKEVYSDMFVDTFGLVLSNLDGDVVERAICATCVSRLREAAAFRRQVLACEETLLRARLMSTDSIIKGEIKEETDLREEASAPTADDRPATPGDEGDLACDDPIDDHDGAGILDDDSIKDEPPPKVTKKGRKVKKAGKKRGKVRGRAPHDGERELVFQELETPLPAEATAVCLKCNAILRRDSQQHEYRAVNLNPELVVIVEKWCGRQVTENDVLCHECMNLLLRAASNRAERARLDSIACISCGTSLAPRRCRRRHRVPAASEERDYIEASIFPRKVPDDAVACHACWMQAYSNLRRK